MFTNHPNLANIQAYTAVRLGCTIENLQSKETTIVPAIKPDHPDFMEPYAVKQADVICVNRLADTTIIRVNQQPSEHVQSVLTKLAVRGNDFSETWLMGLEDVHLHRYFAEPYYYLAPADFKPFTVESTDRQVVVRELNDDDKPQLEALHQTLPENMRWFVEIDHPIIFGCFEDDILASVASHFLFDVGRVAAAGVQTHTDYRQRGYGKAVVSAVAQWAIDHDWTCEWSTWEENPASMALCTALGFREYAVETEYRISALKS
ncbi:MAG: GNAT family N-acetyltransferase [Chloroflexota bacterium]